MLRRSSSRSHRSKKLRASHTFQAFLLVAVAVWIVYQLTHSFGERRPPVAVETGGSSDAEPARRRLGRKGFVRFPGRSSVDAIAGVRSWSDGSSSDEPLSSKAGDSEGDEEDREADEDDGAEGDVDDADDGLVVAADEEDDAIDFQSQDGSHKDDPKAARGGTQNGLNISVVATVNGNGNGTVLDGAAVLLRNATGGAADGTAPTLSLSGSAKNTSSVGMALLRGTGLAGDVGNKLLVSSFAVAAPGAEKPTNNTQKATRTVDNSGVPSRPENARCYPGELDSPCRLYSVLRQKLA